MYINKTTNKNYQLTTNHVNTNYGSSPINIPSSINRSNRLYIHNPLRRNQRRFININLSNSTDLASPLSRNRVRSFNGANDEIQFDDNPYYFSFDKQNIPQKVGFSTFYVGSESSEAFSSIPTESSNYSSDEHIYETIDEHIYETIDEHIYETIDEHIYETIDEHIYETINIPSPLSRNRVRSFNEANDEIQFDDNPYYFSFDEENVPSQVPPKRSDMFLEDNPCYETIEESIPYMLEKVRNHTEFHKKYCKI